MPGSFDNVFIDRVRDSVNISDIIGDYVTLKRSSGGSAIGLCPFHKEKTPSFRVHTDRGFYKCFGCGRGGNVFTFLMEVEGLSFIEALKNIAERTGIDLPQQQYSPEAAKSRTDRDKTLDSLLRTSNLYQKQLLGQNFDKGGEPTGISPDARKAYKYLLDRGIDHEMIVLYQLGWSERGWDGLISNLNRAGVDGHTLVQAGLAHQKKSGTGFVDKFRARVMFPILNLSGKPVAFGSRRIDGITPDDDNAKYINSPETSVYHKGENLYGLFTSREHIRKEGFAYLVEGYTDLLALVQAGIHNAVASLGTALTESQAMLIGRFAKRVVILYDSDSAGISAAIRASDIFTLAGLEAEVVKLPPGEDPDSILQANDAEYLHNILSDKLSFVDFRIRSEGFENGMGQMERIRSARGLLGTIKSITDPLRRDILLQELSTQIGIRRESLEQAMSEIRVRKPAEENGRNVTLKFSGDAIPERDLLHALISYPATAMDCVGKLSPEQITHPFLKELFLHFEQAYLIDSVIDIKSLPEKFTNPAHRAFVASAVMDSEESAPERATEEAETSIRAIQRRDLTKRTKDLEMQINDATRDKKPYRDLLIELMDLKRQLEGFSETEQP